jgi:hypothetical protein
MADVCQRDLIDLERRRKMRPMPSISITGRDLPLPARIFYTAMERQLSLAEYAKSLGLGSDSLRAILTAQLGDLEPAALDRIAELYQQPRETLPEQLQSAAPQETFADWLKRNMEGVTQHALRTRVQVDGKTIRRFLSAEELPDSDLADRIARALYIDRAELARVVTANMAYVAGAERRAAEASAARPQRTRQRGAASSPVASATPAQPPVAPRAAPVLEAISMLNRVANGVARQVPAAGGEAAPPERLRREGAKKPAQAAAEVPATAAAKPAEVRPARAVAMEAPGAKPAEARPARTAAAKGPGARPDATGAPAQLDLPETPEAAAPPAPAAELEQAPPRKQRRARNAPVKAADEAGSPPAEAVAAPGKDASAPAPVEAPPRIAAAPVAERPVSAAAAIPQPTASEPAPARLEAPGAAPEPSPAPRGRQRRAPEAAQASEAPAATAMVAPDTATLQLSADEVRLIRHWRQLHPHGRRATLHYIGSLLVDE